ncbi:MAG: EAL domain-containing protein, partial [Chloroflexi bacterium]|nr:EAL domain-containing protein [Chloroflexota bacterium]
DFIAISEESGAIVTIGRWVLESACHEARTWQLVSGRDDLSVTVNLSARQFQDPMLARTVADAVRSAALRPRSLILEITASVLMQQTQRTMDVLAELREGGVRVAIDDFGTGYSSLSYLRRFPIDVLKIDRAFVSDSRTEQGAILARAIVDIGTGLDMQVIAEGIERPEELRLLRSFGCDYGQGYLFSTPMDAADVMRSIRAGATSLIAPLSSERLLAGAVA